MFETIREYAQELLNASEDATSTHRAHAEWCQSIAAEVQLFFPSPTPLGAALDVVARDLPNARAALIWLLATDPPEATRLASNLSSFWWTRGGFTEALQRLDDVVMQDARPSRARVLVLAHSGLFHAATGDHPGARTLCAQARDLAASLNDPEIVSIAIGWSGAAAEFCGDESFALQCYNEALTLGRAFGNDRIVSSALMNLGDAAFRAGDVQKSRALSTESIETLSSTHDVYITCMIRAMLGWIDVVEGDFKSAVAQARSSLSLVLPLRDPWLTSNALVLVAAIAFAKQDASLAARLLGAANAGRERAGTAIFFHHWQHAQLTNRLTASLGEPAMADALADGRRMSEEEAVASAWAVLRGEADRDLPATVADKTPHELTERELDVLRLLPSGKTDQEIADALFISRRTVTTHVGNILAKLCVANRTEAATKAIDEGII
jgi:non-specific serine/threonine protein kinase